MIACAWLHFAREKVDVAVVEVGLGGRLDATNVLRSEVCAIVSIGLDHMDRLGPDLASIASEKAGILKDGVPMVLGPLPQQALRAIRPAAVERGAPLLLPGEDYEVSGSAQDFRYQRGERVLEDLSVGLQGQHQVENAGVVITVLDELGARLPHLAVSEQALRAGLREGRHPGRCEWLSPRLLVDGAHNPAGAERLAEYLRSLPERGPRTLLLGSSDDKDPRGVASALAGEVDRIYTTRCAHPRAQEAGDVAAALVDLRMPVMPAGDIEQALGMACAQPGLVVVAGSLFLVGAVRDLLAR
jgi:dihydrofolate synthase/folylpolyglutamate synthase